MAFRVWLDLLVEDGFVVHNACHNRWTLDLVILQRRDRARLNGGSRLYETCQGLLPETNAPMDSATHPRVLLCSAPYLPNNEGMRPFALDKFLNHKRPATFGDRPGRLAAVRAYGRPGDNSQILYKIKPRVKELGGREFAIFLVHQQQ